ncbi:hypothetical protein A0O28_0067620 [Trichoderma guizhouense]|uniref:SSCRP protein n=1 Tax=Trichoderma guizhouense TaxID=1491466 RepID=A0A1T3CZU7_9HYPO|nr:hypothetical protein A0O28_0067620 [Trichoderma guizhouense]
MHSVLAFSLGLLAIAPGTLAAAPQCGVRVVSSQGLTNWKQGRWDGFWAARDWLCNNTPCSDGTYTTADGLTSAQTRIAPNIGCSPQSCWNNFEAIIDDCMDTAHAHSTNGGQVSDYNGNAWYWISTNTVLETGN